MAVNDTDYQWISAALYPQTLTSNGTAKPIATLVVEHESGRLSRFPAVGWVQRECWKWDTLNDDWVWRRDLDGGNKPELVLGFITDFGSVLTDSEVLAFFKSSGEPVADLHIDFHWPFIPQTDPAADEYVEEDAEPQPRPVKPRPRRKAVGTDADR